MLNVKTAIYIHGITIFMRVLSFYCMPKFEWIFYEKFHKWQLFEINTIKTKAWCPPQKSCKPINHNKHKDIKTNNRQDQNCIQKVIFLRVFPLEPWLDILSEIPPLKHTHQYLINHWIKDKKNPSIKIIKPFHKTLAIFVWLQYITSNDWSVQKPRNHKLGPYHFYM